MKQRTVRFLVVANAFLALTLAFGANSPAVGDDSWPQWRGPHRDGFVADVRWPDKLSEANLRETWRVQLGPGYSGPIVSGDRVFVTETVDAKREVVRALDRASGEQIWKHEWDGAMSVPFFAKSNGDWIRATPALDGDRLYVAGMRDVLVCLNAATGEEIWRVDFVKQFKSALPAFGFVSSPLIVGDHVFVQAGGGFVKLDKLTGEVVWRVLADGGGMFGSAFSSPLLKQRGEREELLVQTRQSLAGVDPADGDVFWKREIPAFRGMNIVTPTVVGDAVFTSSYGGQSLLLGVDRKPSETDVVEVWTNKSQGYMSSPLLIDDHIYLHLRNRRFTCIDAKTGDGKWTTTPFGAYWSLVTNGRKILALDQRGELLLINANPEKFELLDQRKIGSDTWAHLAVCGSELFIRHLDAIVAYRWQGDASAADNQPTGD